MIEEPDVLVGELVPPDDLDLSPESRIHRLIRFYQENPVRDEHPNARCPACGLAGPPGSISARWHADGTFHWTSSPRVRCTFCSNHHLLDPADSLPCDATTACSRCAVAIHHPAGASQIACLCCHLIAPGAADKNPELHERRRLAETRNIRQLQDRLQTAKDRKPGLAAHLADPLHAESISPTPDGRA
ncbi:hypothetical protein [Streptomyces bacillaris]|uniref:hypothetical protein n=1 Tax=Streptomyces bacillaris TaxID=68179 RepID=UPI00381B8CD4